MVFFCEVGSDLFKRVTSERRRVFKRAAQMSSRAQGKGSCSGFGICESSLGAPVSDALEYWTDSAALARVQQRAMRTATGLQQVDDEQGG